MGKPFMSPALQEKFIHVKCRAKEPLYSNSMVIAGWLLSTRAQNIPFKCTWLLQRVKYLSIFTFEHILCLSLSLIYPAVYLLNKDLCELSVVDTAPELCQKGDIFPEKKRMEGILFMFWNICLL